MTDENRQFKRRALTHRATLMMDGQHDTRSCVVRDVSNTGARILVPAKHDLPETFTLLLASGGGATRRCQLVWREGDVVGVRFENR